MSSAAGLLGIGVAVRTPLGDGIVIDQFTDIYGGMVLVLLADQRRGLEAVFNRDQVEEVKE